MSKNLNALMKTVIENDYCIGCGICASIENSPLIMKLDENGKYKPYFKILERKDETGSDLLSLCPFSNLSKDENKIGSELFGQHTEISFNQYTGFYLRNYAGFVKEGDYRKNGSSGGMGSWIASQLLKENLVDGIIHVKSSDKDKNTLFEYQVSYNEAELLSGSKSKYYPIELSQIIKFVRENEGRYALIGIPCYIKAVRLLSDEDKIIEKRIKYTIGLVCGHLKSDLFAKSIGWQLGILPENIESIDFRIKSPGKSANHYSVEVIGKREGNEVRLTSPTKDLYTTNWGHGLFKYNACEFCDDVLAETADVTVGDAWLPQFIKDSMGTNVITVRNPDILKLIEKNQDKIEVSEVSAEQVYKSQAGGFRHRREGLSYRLYLKDYNNQWRPKKRVEAKNELSSRKKRIIEERLKLSHESFIAFKLAEQKEDFNEFIKYMDPMINKYNKLIEPSMMKKVFRKVKMGIKNMLKT